MEMGNVYDGISVIHSISSLAVNELYSALYFLIFEIFYLITVTYSFVNDTAVPSYICGGVAF